jgi:phosphate starvation-inducible membrane PsiE
MILRDKPLISEVVLSQLVSKQDWGKMHIKASKSHNNIFGKEHLAHIRTIVVSLGGMLTYVLIYATTELHQRRYVVIFGVSYFVVDDLILLFVPFVELLGLVDAFFCCLWIFLVVCV